MARTFVNSTDDKAENTTAAPVTGYPLTIAAWVRITTDPTGDDYCIAQIQDKDVDSHQFRLGLAAPAGGQFQFGTADGSMTECIGTTVPNQDQWYHVGGVETTPSSRAIWVNGIEENTNVVTKNPANIDSITIGREGDSSPGDSWEGGIAEVAVWNVPLEAVDFGKLAAGYSPLLVRPESLVAYWPLFGQESPEPDEMGWGDLTLTNTSYLSHPTIVYPDPPASIPAVRTRTLNRSHTTVYRRSQARSFLQSSSQGLNVSKTVDLSYPFSFGGWWKLISENNGATLLCIGSDSGDDRARIIVNSGTGEGRYNINASSGNLALDAPVINDGNWHHMIAVSKATDDHAIYVDGVKTTSATAVGASLTTHNMSIGQSVVGGSGDNYLDGWVANAAIWTGVALTDGDVWQLFQGVSPLKVRRNSLTSLWTLEGNDVDIVGVNTMSPSNAPTWGYGPQLLEPIPRTFPVTLPTPPTPPTVGAARTWTRKQPYRQDQQFSRPFRLNRRSPQASGIKYFYTSLMHSTPGWMADIVSGNNANAVGRITLIRDSGLGTGIESISKASSPSHVRSERIPATPGSYSYQIVLKGVIAGDEGNTGRQPVLMSGSAIGGVDAFGFSFDHVNAAFRKAAFHQDTGGYHASQLTTSLVGNTWYWIGVSWDGSSALKVYLNGILEDTETGVTDVVTLDEDLVLGHASNTLDRTINIASFIYWENRTLVDSDFRKLYAPQTRWELYEPIPRLFPVTLPAPLESGAVRKRVQPYRQDQQFSRLFRLNADSWQAKGLSAWFPLQGDSENYQNSPIVVDNDTSAPVHENTTRGRSYDFTNGNFLGSAQPISFGRNYSITISGWIRAPSNPSNDGKWFQLVDPGEANNWITGDGEGGASPTAMVLAYRWGGTINKMIMSGSFFDDVWRHFVFTYDALADEGKGYINGVWKITDPTSAGTNNITSTDIYIGYESTGGNRRWEGNISDVRLYNRVLSASEVYQLYAPDTRWELYEPLPRTFPVVLTEEIMAAIIGPFPTHFRV